MCDLRNFKRGNYCHVYPTQSDSRLFELLSNVWPERRYITIHDACVVITGLGRNAAQLGPGFHVDRLPPRVLSFAIRSVPFEYVRMISMRGVSATCSLLVISCLVWVKIGLLHGTLNYRKTQ